MTSLPPPAADPPDQSRDQGASYLRACFLLPVAVGGALGTLARYLLGHAFGAPLGHASGQWPTITFAINVGGSFLLGVLVVVLAHGIADDDTRRVLRVGLGTGLLGGFTTYSTFAVEGNLLAADGRPGLAVGYVVGSVALGWAAAATGVVVAARAVRSQPTRRVILRVIRRSPR